MPTPTFIPALGIRLTRYQKAEIARWYSNGTGQWPLLHPAPLVLSIFLPGSFRSHIAKSIYKLNGWYPKCDFFSREQKWLLNSWLNKKYKSFHTIALTWSVPFSILAVRINVIFAFLVVVIRNTPVNNFKFVENYTKTTGQFRTNHRSH